MKQVRTHFQVLATPGKLVPSDVPDGVVLSHRMFIVADRVEYEVTSLPAGRRCEIQHQDTYCAFWQGTWLHTATSSRDVVDPTPVPPVPSELPIEAWLATLPVDVALRARRVFAQAVHDAYVTHRSALAREDLGDVPLPCNNVGP